MADGFLVETTTPQSGGDPVTAMWYAHIPEEEKALAAVRKEAGEAAGGAAGITAKIVKPLTHLILTGVSVPEGGVKPYD